MQREGRHGARGVTALDASIAIAVLGCALAAIVPACVRSVRLARTAEATEQLERLSVAAIQHHATPGAAALTTTPLTPSSVPRGQTVTDPPGTWDHPTFKALSFSIEEPHWYSYRVEIDAAPGTPLRVIAHGDLDGDGVTSTFERTATLVGNEWVARPGVTITADLE